MQMNAKYWRKAVGIGGIVSGLIVAPAMAPAQESADPEAFGVPSVIAPNLNAYGNTYGEWSARWWQWVLSVPANKNPNLDTTGVNCAEAQTGPVWFLGGTFGGFATRNCTVPRGKALLFPVGLCTAFGHGVGDCTTPNECDPNVIRKAAAALIDNPRTLIARIDGKSVQLLKQFRVTSPVFNMFLPPGNVGLPPGIPSGAYGPVVSDGYFMLVRPLSPGAHTIYFKGVDKGGFVVEVRYDLTVLN
jgi:hypothetical protein